MFNRTNLVIVAIALIGGIGGFLAGGFLRAPLPQHRVVEAPALKPGSPAPAASRPDLDGKPHALADWRGKLVLVNFWASWCAPCRAEMPLLDRTQQHLSARGLQIVGIAVDDADSVREFLGKLPVHYPILIDDPVKDGDLTSTFGDARGVLPYSVLIGRDGSVLASRAGGFTEATLQQWLLPHL